MEGNNPTTEPTAEELKAQLAAEKAAKDEALKVIAQQNDKIAELDAQKVSGQPVVTVDKVQYDIVVPTMTVDGKKLTAADIAKDASLAQKLVEMGSGALVKKEKPAKA